MPNRYAILSATICIAMLLAFLFGPEASYAIGKVTPTPTPEGQPALPKELDIDAALEEVLEHIDAEAFDEAIGLADEILQQDEETWKAYYYRGFAHSRSEDWEDAIADYSAVLELRPHDSAIWRLRGELHLKNSNPRQAKRDYEQSLTITSRSTQTYSSLFACMSETATASCGICTRVSWMRRAPNAQGSSNQALFILDEAIESFDRGSTPSELGYAYFMRAKVWTDTKSWDNALADMNAALALQPLMQDYYWHEVSSTRKPSSWLWQRRISTDA